MGTVAGGDGDVYSIGDDARTDILLYGPNEAQLGVYLVLCYPWRCFDGGDYGEEGVAGEVAAAAGSISAGDPGFHLPDCDLVVFSTVREVAVGREGV